MVCCLMFTSQWTLETNLWNKTKWDLFVIQVHHIGMMASWRGVGMTCWLTKTICPSQGYQIYHMRDIDTIQFGIYSSTTSILNFSSVCLSVFCLYHVTFLAPTLFHRGGALDLAIWLPDWLTGWLREKFALPIWTG